MQKNWFSIALILCLSLLFLVNAGYSLLLVYQSQSEIKTFLNPANTYPMLYHITVLLPESNDPFIEQLKTSIEKAVTADNGAVEFLFYTQQNSTADSAVSSKAEELFNLALNANVDGIIMFFSQAEYISSYAKRAKQASVPFTAIAMNYSSAADSYYVVSSDSYAQGKYAIQEALSVLGNSARIGIIVPYSTTDTVDSASFLNGAKTALLEHGKGKISAVIFEGDPALQGEEAGFTLFHNKPDINVIICSTAHISMNTAQLLIDKSLVGKILLIGSDENSEISRLLEKGVFKATIIRNADAIGKAAQKLIMEQIQKTGKPIQLSIKPIIKSIENK
ncbi:MAG TPA: sugar ABC transporter substrate-binding protein [Spirochaetales bacterium]|nr:sugar ABC transporter substrate-binding protein [Spirochaetales bacterium]HQK33146.1 sugar ABC transporter substrate-binding protein [Spirochaetales bacterium]HRV27859.1 sugar ABC transporter substrate-binding protein [Spirochaetia bacterium]